MKHFCSVSKLAIPSCKIKLSCSGSDLTWQFPHMKMEQCYSMPKFGYRQGYKMGRVLLICRCFYFWRMLAMISSWSESVRWQVFHVTSRRHTQTSCWTQATHRRWWSCQKVSSPVSNSPLTSRRQRNWVGFLLSI